MFSRVTSKPRDRTGKGTQWPAQKCRIKRTEHTGGSTRSVIANDGRQSGTCAKAFASSTAMLYMYVYTASFPLDPPYKYGYITLEMGPSASSEQIQTWHPSHLGSKLESGAQKHSVKAETHAHVTTHAHVHLLLTMHSHFTPTVAHTQKTPSTQLKFMIATGCLHL